MRAGLAGRVKQRAAAGGAGRPAVPYDRVLEVDAKLVQAAKGIAALRLQLGEAFELLTGRGWEAKAGSGAKAGSEAQAGLKAEPRPAVEHAAKTEQWGGGNGVEQRQMSGGPEADASSRSLRRLRGWHSSLVTSAALLRAHLGLSSGARAPAGALDRAAAEVVDGPASDYIQAGPAREFDRLAAGMVDRQMSGRVGARAKPGWITLRFRVRESTARFWREVERDALRWLPRGMCFAEFACVMVWRAWHHLLDRKVAHAEV
jgi:hypothetical protein